MRESIVTAVKEGGFASFGNKSGKLVASIGSTSAGNGFVRVNGKTVHDYAEVFDLATREGVVPGTVMSAVDDGVGLAPSTESYDQKAVGVVAGAGAFTAGARIGTRQDGTNDLPITLNGQVYVRVCLAGGPVKVGDLLVSSNRQGVAMRAADRERAFGAVVGKALEPYEGEFEKIEGLVRMLVMSR